MRLMSQDGCFEDSEHFIRKNRISRKTLKTRDSGMLESLNITGDFLNIKFEQY